MSQPLLFFWRSRRRFSASTDLSKFDYLYFEVARRRLRFSTRFVDNHFKQSVDTHNPCGFDRFAQETVTEHAAWLRIVVHFGTDVLKRETELVSNAVSEAGLTVPC